jgi:hypothetical protein
MPLPRLSSSLRAAHRLTALSPARSSPILIQPLSLSTRLNAESNTNPQKDAQQDREKINTDANEYAKSGTDDTTAGNEEAAFDTNHPDPQEAKRKAGEGNDVNPLDVSPANPEISQPTREGSGERKKGEI